MSLPLSLRTLLLLAGLTAAGAGVVVALSRSWTTDDSAPPSIQQLVLPDLEGRERAIQEWAGKTLLINFWATWCAPCREEIPLLQEAQARHAAQGLQVIGVAIDDPADVVAYTRNLRIDYPVLLGDFDALAFTAHLGNSAQVLPFTLIVSPAGKTVANKVGSYGKSELHGLLAGILPTRSAAR